MFKNYFFTFSLIFTISSLVYGVKIDIKTSYVSHTVDERYASYTLDLWQPVIGQPPSWKDASALFIDLSDLKLKTLAKQLSPSYLRIGGTLGNFWIYDFPNSPTMELLNLTFACPGDYCLTTTRLEELVNFCKEVDCKLILGLNELIGRFDNEKYNYNKWDYKNTFDLLNHIKEKKYVENGMIYGFELGNQNDIILSVGEMIEDYKILSNELNRLWKDSNIKPKLIGADVYNVNEEFVRPFLISSEFNLDIFTYHNYDINGTDDDILNKMLKPEFHNKHRNKAELASRLVNEYNPKTIVCMGEGASIAMSGKENISDRYVNTLYYIDELSSLAEIGIKMNFRQTLVGGYYSLISNEKSHIPRPDYYILYLYKKLVGDKVLSSYSNDEYTRVYSDCSKEFSGGIVVVVMNLNDKSVEINAYDNSIINLESNRYEYKLNSDRLDSKDINLNNKLFTINDDGSIDEVEKKEMNGTLTAEPYSVNFFIYYDANVDVCKFDDDNNNKKNNISLPIIITVVSVAVVLSIVFACVKYFMLKDERAKMLKEELLLA